MVGGGEGSLYLAGPVGTIALEQLQAVATVPASLATRGDMLQGNPYPQILYLCPWRSKEKKLCANRLELCQVEWYQQIKSLALILVLLLGCARSEPGIR